MKLELLAAPLDDQRVPTGDLFNAELDPLRSRGWRPRNGSSRSRLFLLPVMLAKDIEEHRTDSLIATVYAKLTTPIACFDFLNTGV